MRKMTTPFSALSPALRQDWRRPNSRGRVITQATINSLSVIPAKAGITDRTGCQSNNTIRNGAGLFCLLWLSLLIGCGFKSAPAWITQGHKQLETYKTDFLTGERPIVTERYFQKAVEELKKSGDLDLLQKAWLTRMALQVAVLEKAEEGDYPKIEAALPVPANRNFHLFLTGDPAAVDASLLPKAYRPFLTALQSGNTIDTAKKIAGIDDPLSRLIASGLTMRLQRANETILQTAAETAAQNGWQRALLAWLKELKGFYEKREETTKAEAIGRRLAVIAP